MFTPNLAGNATGRALVFVDLVGRQRQVVLAGPRKGPIWKPLEGRAPGLKVLDLGARGWRPSRETRHVLEGAIPVLVKPLFSSFGQWLLAGHPSPAVLDIDDPELALMRSDLRTLARSMASLDGPFMTALLSRLIDRVDAVTVSNSSLQAQDDMVVIPHARDERLFELEESRSRDIARRQLDLPAGGELVVFVGTDRRHKGVDVLIQAAPAVSPARIVIVGGLRRPRSLPSNVTVVPPVRYSEAIRWLAAANVVAVPQLDGPVGRQQAPAKIVDAMAAGRAIVASDLPPIREMVREEALLVVPGSAASLAAGINSLLSDTARRESMEQGLRQRFLTGYSLSSVRPILERVLERVEGA